jgi:hypothetical protein
MAFINCDFKWTDITNASDRYNAQAAIVSNLKAEGQSNDTINAAIDVLNGIAHEYNQFVQEYESNGCGTVNPGSIADMPHVGQTAPPPPSGGTTGGTTGGTGGTVDLSGVVSELGGIIAVLNGQLGAIDRDIPAAINGQIVAALSAIYTNLAEYQAFQESPSNQGIAGLVQTLQAFFIWYTKQGTSSGSADADLLNSFFTFMESPDKQGLAGLVQTFQAWALHNQDITVPGAARTSEDLHQLLTLLIGGEGNPLATMAEALTGINAAIDPLTKEASPETRLEKMTLDQLAAAQRLQFATTSSADRVTQSTILESGIDPNRVAAGDWWPFSGLFNMIQDVIRTIGPPMVETVSKVMDPIESITEPIARAVLDDMIQKLNEFGKANPENYVDNANTAFLAQLSAGTKAHLFSVAAELHPLIHHLGFPQLAAFLVDMGGFRETARAVVGSRLEAGLHIPSLEGARAQFEPTNPNLPLLDILVQKREIDETGYKNYLQYLGYDSDWREFIYESAFREPRIFDLATAMQDVSVDPAWITQKIKRSGYADADIDHITTGLIQRASKSSRDKVVTQGIDAFVEGMIDAAGLDSLFDTAGLSQDQRKFEIIGAQWRAKIQRVKDLIALYTEQLRDGVLPLEDFSVQLTALGIGPDHVNLIVAKETARIQKTLVQKETAAAKAQVSEQQKLLIPRYLTLYRDGAIDDSSFQAALVSLGLTAQLAAQLVQLEGLTKTITADQKTQRTALQFADTVQNENIQAMVDLFRASQIDINGLESGLLQLGVPNAQAAAITSVERARALKGAALPAPVPVTAKESQILSQYQGLLKQQYEAGMIDDATFQGELVAAGMDPNLAAIITQREVLKVETKAAGKSTAAAAAVTPSA